MHHATPLITTIVGGLVLAFILGMLANKLLRALLPIPSLRRNWLNWALFC